MRKLFVAVVGLVAVSGVCGLAWSGVPRSAMSEGEAMRHVLRQETVRLTPERGGPAAHVLRGPSPAAVPAALPPPSWISAIPVHEEMRGLQRRARVDMLLYTAHLSTGAYAVSLHGLAAAAGH